MDVFAKSCRMNARENFHVGDSPVPLGPLLSSILFLGYRIQYSNGLETVGTVGIGADIGGEFF